MELKEHTNISSTTLFWEKQWCGVKKLYSGSRTVCPVQLTETAEDQKSWQYTTVQEMWMNGQTGMTKLRATFCNFANTPRLSGIMNCYESLANNKNLLPCWESTSIVKLHYLTTYDPERLKTKRSFTFTMHQLAPALWTWWLIMWNTGILLIVFQIIYKNHIM
jgi:hypothetical protein